YAGHTGSDDSQLITDPSLATIAPQRGHTHHPSDAICSSASSKSRLVGSFVDSSAAEQGDASGAPYSSAPPVPIAGNSQRGSKRCEGELRLIFGGPHSLLDCGVDSK